MRSVMTHSFSKAPQAKIERSTFDRSHGMKTTFNESHLIPIFVDEVLPGDTFHLRSTLFGRLATPIFPVMDNMFLDVFYFYVPCRLVWNHWVNFMGESDTAGVQPTTYLVPTTSVPTSTTSNTLADYFGIPVVNFAGGGNLVVNALPFRSYLKIWNDWFRDENLQDVLPVPMDDGPDAWANYVNLRDRGKRKDYFTSCLPWPQKGPAVTVPIGGTPWIQTATSNNPAPTTTQPVRYWDATTHAFSGTSQGLGVAATVGSAELFSSPAVSGAGSLVAPANLYADLSTAAGVTINQLRQSFQIQRIYERDARGGTRYIELIKSHFGVTSPDARLQRSEYLGGGSTPINVNPIAQTSATGLTGGNTPAGNLSAMATLHSHNVGFSKSFTEHGYVIGLVNLRADITYQDGIDKMWSRSTRFDFFWPALAHLGEQAVLNQEIFAQGTAADLNVFGYQERYAEYRYKNSRICGSFRSSAIPSLDVWHLSQHYTTAAAPALNAAFIVDNPPVSRVVAVPTQPRVLLDIYHRLICARPMPTYSVPGLIDHF